MQTVCEKKPGRPKSKLAASEGFVLRPKREIHPPPWIQLETSVFQTLLRILQYHVFCYVFCSYHHSCNYH